jgi:hypothetical protein
MSSIVRGKCLCCDEDLGDISGLRARIVCGMLVIDYSFESMIRKH